MVNNSIIDAMETLCLRVILKVSKGPQWPHYFIMGTHDCSFPRTTFMTTLVVTLTTSHSIIIGWHTTIVFIEPHWSHYIMWWYMAIIFCHSDIISSWGYMTSMFFQGHIISSCGGTWQLCFAIVTLYHHGGT